MQWIQRIYNKYIIWSNLFRNSNGLHRTKVYISYYEYDKTIYICVRQTMQFYI